MATTAAITREAQSLLLRWRRALRLTNDPPAWSDRDVDGIAGPRTRAAVARFQRTWNGYGLELQLPTNGELDELTLQALRDDVVRIGAPDRFGWTPDDYRALVRAAGELVARPADLLLVLLSESGLNPHAAFVDAKGFPVAVGLNQITPTNARAMGITETERRALRDKSPAEQLPFVVRSFHAAAGRRNYTDAGQLYQVNFAPATLTRGSADNLALYRREQGAVYALNAGLDVNHDGTITVGDMRAHLRRIAGGATFREALANLRDAAGVDIRDPVVSDAA